MSLRFEKPALRSVYDAMLAAGGEHVSNAGASTLKRIAETGWAHEHQIEDIVQMADRRLSAFGYEFTPTALAQGLGAAKQQFCYRPKARSASVSCFSGWTAFDAARMLVLLEDIGFAVDPSPLIAALKPSLPKSGLMPMGALDVLWYDRTRGKSKIALRRDAEGDKPSEFRDHKLPRGYRMTALLDESGDPISVEVRGPKYRKQPPQVQVVCEKCGVEWTRGDPDSSFLHRREHKMRMEYLDPQPHPNVLAETREGRWIEEVTARSPRWRHSELHKRALAFKREERYDFVQWDDPDRDRDARGFLFSDDAGRLVGGCAFRFRRYTDATPGWALQFIWVAPAYRQQGVLAARWPQFRKEFGDFHIEGPVSKSMQAFARKAGDERLMFGTDEAYAAFLAKRP